MGSHTKYPHRREITRTPPFFRPLDHSLDWLTGSTGLARRLGLDGCQWARAACGVLLIMRRPAQPNERGGVWSHLRTPSNPTTQHPRRTMWTTYLRVSDNPCLFVYTCTCPISLSVTVKSWPMSRLRILTILVDAPEVLESTLIPTPPLSCVGPGKSRPC